MENKLTTGSVFKNIIYFALPYMLSYFMQTLYGMADLYITGRFNGVDAITAITNGSQIMHMITVIIVGLAMGTTVVIGKAAGAGDKKNAASAVGNTITLFMTLSAVCTILLLILVRPLVGVIGIPKEAVSGTVTYLTICFIGIPFITAYNIISSIFRGLGDSKTPMYFIGIACIANIIMDYFFIGVCNMGPAGAALGTTLSQTLSVVVSLLVMKNSTRGIHLCKKDFIPDKEIMWGILKVGIPVAVQDGCIQVAFILITVIANHRGLNDAAAVGIVEKMISAIFIIPSAMLATVSALSAQNIGAGRHDRAEKTLWYSTLITIIYGSIMT
ncbi:MAG: MATE family efflux transporter, partial [Lachnospira sp.]|nr:MATE family efflux transporter [Lachnospira sp.]